MLSRDGLRALRALATDRYICPSCSSRSISRSSRTSRKHDLEPKNPRGCGRKGLPENRRQASSAPANDSNIDPALEAFLIAPRNAEEDRTPVRRDIRKYLKQWQDQNLREKQAAMPGALLRDDAIKRARTTAFMLPNSLFARHDGTDTVEKDKGEEDIAEETKTPEVPASSNPEEGADEYLLNERSLRPGDLIMLRDPSTSPQLALYLGRQDVQVQFLTMSGKWFVSTKSRHHGLTTPNFASEREMQAIRTHLPIRAVEMNRGEDGNNIPIAAEGRVPTKACSAVLMRGQLLYAEMEAAKRRYSDALNGLYDRVAHDTLFKHILWDDLLRDHIRVNPKELSEGARRVIYDFLESGERMFPLTHKKTHMISVMPKSFANTAKVVTAWVRSYQDAASQAATGRNVSAILQNNPISHFVSKARRIIIKSRKIRKPTSEGHISPTLLEAVQGNRLVHESSGEEFTSDDKQILQFLWLCFWKTPVIKSATTLRHHATSTLILRAIGAYPDADLDGVIGRTFLTELGCTDPWLNQRYCSVDNPFDILGLNHDAEAVFTARRNALRKLDPVALASKTLFSDTLADIRVDLGDLEVFTVDKKGTVLIDDGISFEPAEDGSGDVWLHAHVAHLSSILPKDSELVKSAMYMSGSAYGQGFHVPMIPFPVLYCANVAKGRPALTISTRLSPDGSVKDRQVRPTILNNIIKIHTDALGKEFEAHQYRFHTKLIHRTLGQAKSRSEEEDMELNSSHSQREVVRRHVPIFKKITAALEQRLRARDREIPEKLTSLQADLMPLAFTVRTGEEESKAQFEDETRRSKLVEALSYKRIFRSEFVRGDPTIEIRIGELHQRRYNVDNATVTHLVAGSMLLAGETMAQWLSERSIPAIYSKYKFAPGYDMTRLNNAGRHEPVVAPTGGESLHPAYFPGLNLKSYTQVTSPLRRYKDLMHSYNVDCFLRTEADAKKLGLSVDTTTQAQVFASPQEEEQAMEDGSYEHEITDQFTHTPSMSIWTRTACGLQPAYPFPATTLQDYLFYAPSHYKAIGRLSRSDQDHWLGQFLYRAFYFPNEMSTPLPPILEVCIGSPAQTGISTTAKSVIVSELMPFGLSCYMAQPGEGEPGYKKGWEHLGLFRQYQRVRIDLITLGKGIYVVPVGRPTETPMVTSYNKLFATNGKEGMRDLTPEEKAKEEALT